MTQISSVHHTFGQVLEVLLLLYGGFLIGTFLSEAKYCWSVRRPGLTTMHDNNLYRYITMISSATWRQLDNMHERVSERRSKLHKSKGRVQFEISEKSY